MNCAALLHKKEEKSFSSSSTEAGTKKGKWIRPLLPAMDQTTFKLPLIFTEQNITVNLLIAAAYLEQLSSLIRWTYLRIVHFTIIYIKTQLCHMNTNIFQLIPLLQSSHILNKQKKHIPSKQYTKDDSGQPRSCAIEQKQNKKLVKRKLNKGIIVLKVSGERIVFICTYDEFDDIQWRSTSF